MSKGKRRPEALEIRVADEDDEDALMGFRCSSSLECEEEVETYLNEQASKAIASGVADYRMLMAYEDEKLVGVAGHHLDFLTLKSGPSLVATRLHVIAIAPEYRGKALKGDERLSDRLIASVIEDAGRRREGDIFTAIVANENDRSLAMFERVGSWSQVAYDASHVRLTGRFTL